VSRAAELILLLALTALLVLAGAAAAFGVEAPSPEIPDVAGETTTPVVATPEPDPVPDISVTVESESSALSNTVTIIVLLTIAGVAPGILLLMTAFTRFVVVLGLTRNAVGVQTIPPSQVLIGLALILTFFVMGPVFTMVNDDAVQPLLAGDISQSEAISAGYEPLREFMLAQTRDDDLRLFMSLSEQEKPETPEEVSATTLIPAFVISELRTAFIIGFLIFIPFLVIDLVVSAVLMSMGMVMLPPVFISLPLKLLLFVLVDGWALLIGSVVQSVNGVGA
jgi:flagellar biosynthetic protein FliP